VFFFGLLMAPIVVDVQLDAGRRQRCMAELVAHMRRSIFWSAICEPAVCLS
jgi:hypothetical protein